MSDKKTESPVYTAGTKIERVKKDPVRKVSGYISLELAVELRDHCHDHNKKITDIIELALEEYLAKHRK